MSSLWLCWWTQLTAGQQNSVELESHSLSHWENSGAAAKHTLWSSVFYHIFSPPQLTSGRALYQNEELGRKAWNKTWFMYLFPTQEHIRFNPRAWHSAQLPLAAPGVQELLLNLQPSAASWRAVIFQEGVKQGKAKKTLCSVGFLRPLWMHNLFFFPVNTDFFSYTLVVKLVL